MNIMQKSHPESKIINFSANSTYSDRVLSEKPRLDSYTAIVVLQVMSVPSGFVVEYVEKEDYEQ